MSPTAIVGMPASRRIAAANGTWYPGSSGICAWWMLPPLEQSIMSMPIAFSRRASSIDCARSQPPSAHSVADTR
jgi:hypothetical protein